MLNFQHFRSAWTAQFLCDDCRTPIGPRTRYLQFPALDDLRSFVQRCYPEDATLAGFDNRVRAWGRGK
jgi:hypothetical protein